MKNGTKTYIAYGSNLNIMQMGMRCPTARAIGNTVLKGYRLLFRGGAGYAVATVEKKESSEVPVLAWKLQPKDEEALDRYEGYPHLYRKEYVDVKLEGKKVKAMIYVMNDGRPLDAPGKQYLCTIASGYMSAGFDARVLERAVLESTRR
jgi:gamma-glutamylcyclotransferase (GGCT)/AIG2-like uncharacterized protein YtfP